MSGARSLLLAAVAAAGLAAATLGAAQAQAPARPLDLTAFGTWRNPKGSVHVEIRPCGVARACGYVVWADPNAQADARRGGTDKLIGLQVFRDMAQDDGGVWKGKVFVPDLNMTFSGTAKLRDAVTLRARGCLIGGFICRSQTWTRIAA